MKKSKIAEGFAEQARAAMKRPFESRGAVLDNLKLAVEAAAVRHRGDGFVTVSTFQDGSEFDILSALAPLYDKTAKKKKS
jgi:hypothetical protein